MIRPQVQYLVFVTFVTFFSSCGNSNVSEKRAPVVSGIIHGERADETKYSFVATLLKNKSQICSATLVSNEFALTSAHCLLEDARYDIIIGNRDYKIQEIITHPDFNYENDNYTDFDIALIRFEKTDIKKIEIADSKTKKNPIALGLGLTENEEIGSLYQKEVKLKKQSSYCEHRFGETTLLTTKAVYSADSGGALIQDGKLIGINSAYKLNKKVFKKLFCDRSFYTDVTILKDWIEKYI